MSRFSRLAVPLLLSGLFLVGCAGSKETADAAFPVLTDTNLVAQVGNDGLTISDFETRYARTAGSRKDAAADSLAEYQEFLNRYVNFRLKIAEAMALGLDKQPEILQEMKDYRQNLGRPYLLDQNVYEPIMKDVFSRIQRAVSASHILIAVDKNAPPRDTLQAFLKIRRLTDSLKAGADFNDLAFRFSDDPSSKTETGPGARGNLGWFTYGMMVPEFEDQAYSVPVGQVSPIFRSQFGYHLLKVHERGPAVPDIRIAHILTMFEGDSTAARTKIDEVRRKLDAGEQFEDLARQYSQHEASASKGGELGEMNYYMGGGVPENFKDAAFALKDVGDTSAPIQTPYGYHIIKLLGRRDLSSLDASYDVVKRHVVQLPRAKAAVASYGRSRRPNHTVVYDSTAFSGLFASFSRDSMLTALLTDQFPDNIKNATLATIDDSTYTVSDFAELASTGRLQVPANATLGQLGYAFVDDRILAHEANTLENYDPEFKRIMGEFFEGLLLFRVMENNVWNRASADTLQVRAYYDAHADRYRFGNRVKAIRFQSERDSALVHLSERIRSGVPVATLVAEFAGSPDRHMTVDTLLIEEGSRGEMSVVFNLTNGQATEPMIVGRRKALLYRVSVEPPRAKNFEEARASVMSDYQEQLDTDLLERLRKKFPVRTWPERLTKAFAAERNGAPAVASSDDRN